MRIVLIASTLAVLAATASATNTAAAAVGQKGEKHTAAAARKHRALRNTNKAGPADDVQLVAEDEAY